MEQRSHNIYMHKTKHNEMTNTLFQTYTASTETDVTLVCDDEQIISAHKNILAAGSPFLSSLFPTLSESPLKLWF